MESVKQFATDFFANHPTKKVVIGEDNFDYLVGGSGETVILVFPGAGQDAYSCWDLIDYYEKKYKVIAVNYSGLSSLEQFFRYVNKILLVEGAKKVILYGLSLGGYLAQAYIRKPNNVDKIVLSHTGSIKSKEMKRVKRISKVLHAFLPVLPIGAFAEKVSRKIAGKVQSGKSDIVGLYRKYGTENNLEKRRMFGEKLKSPLFDKAYLRSIYRLGMDTVKDELGWRSLDRKNILVIRSDNDPLAQDAGAFKAYYPNAKVYTFKETGHLTPFIQFETMVKVIDKFL